jgi:hypothetical protein
MGVLAVLLCLCAASIGALAAGPIMAAAKAAATGGFDRTGLLVAGGKRVIVNGSIKCTKGGRFSLRIRIGQGHRSTSVTAPSQSCRGASQRWQVEEIGRQALRPGTAVASVVATISVPRRSSVVRRWSGKLYLSPRVGDFWVVGRLIFRIRAGTLVSIVGGGQGSSNCTSEETNTSFVTKGGDDRHDIAFIAKDGGSCGVEASYSLFDITFPNSPYSLSPGTLWLGQPQAGDPFYLRCYTEWRGPLCRRGDNSLTLIIAAR